MNATTNILVYDPFVGVRYKSKAHESTDVSIHSFPLLSGTQ